MKKYTSDPLVAVDIRQLRQQTFTPCRLRRAPRPYFIPSTDHKLIREAITAGGQNDNTKEIFVIRRVAAPTGGR